MDDDNKGQVIVGRNFFGIVVSIYEYIKKSSPQNAENFRAGIRDKMEMVDLTPEPFL
jgi:hypothetical protein